MKKLFSLLLVLYLLLSQPVCGLAAAREAESISPAGIYKLSGIAGGSGSSLELVSSVIDLGVGFYLVLNEDGSGCMRFLEAEIPLNWDEENIMFPPHGSIVKELSLPYSCHDGSLSIQTLAYSMEFLAMSEAEKAEFEAEGSGSLSGMLSSLVQRLLNGLDGDLIENLLSSLALGLPGAEAAPIPEGEPSAGTVAGRVEALDINILGASHAHDEELGDVIVLYCDVVNRSDDFYAAWMVDCEASQNGSFLENVYVLEAVPEVLYVNLDIYPGRTLRCAFAFQYDPDAGVVGFRISSYSDKSALLYYADPQDLSGAPAEPFAFDSDPSIPAELEALPEETEQVRIENVEAFTAEDGSAALRVYYRTPYISEESDVFFYCTALQDGIELKMIWEWSDDDVEGAAGEADTEPVCTHACQLRTKSPVIFIIYEQEGFSHGTAVASKVAEIA